MLQQPKASNRHLYYNKNTYCQALTLQTHPIDLILPWLHLHRPYFQVRSYSQVGVVVVYGYAYIWGGHNPTYNRNHTNYGHSGIKLEINNRKIAGKIPKYLEI